VAPAVAKAVTRIAGEAGLARRRGAKLDE